MIETCKIKTNYYENGNIHYKKYYFNGKLHNENGPAVIDYYENGNKYYEEYYINGEFHREDGPALITIDIFTGSARHYYLLNNYFLEKEDYDMVINNIKNDQIVIDTNSLVLIEGFKLAADFYNKPDLITELIKKEVLIKLLGEEI